MREKKNEDGSGSVAWKGVEGWWRKKVNQEERREDAITNTGVGRG